MVVFVAAVVIEINTKLFNIESNDIPFTAQVLNAANNLPFELKAEMLFENIMQIHNLLIKLCIRSINFHHSIVNYTISNPEYFTSDFNQ